VDPFANPQLAGSSDKRGLRGPLLIAALIVAMVTLSIAGSAYWRPAWRSDNTLELGGAVPVGLDARPAGETISAVLDLVAPTVALLTIPEVLRSGSGVLVHEAGFIVTNAHVVEGVEELLVTFNDGSEYEAVVYGIDSATDLAVVKVESDTPLPAAALGDSDRLQVGEFVLALGAPLGLEFSATSGIVSGLHRSGLGIARYEDFIVTDAPINRGNSGGPLMNLRGEVVGINTAIIAGEEGGRGRGGFSGVGFAIPVNVMRVVAQRLIGDGGLAEPDGAAPGTVALAADSTVDPAPTAIAAEMPFVSQEAGSDDYRYSVAMVQSFDSDGRRLRMGSGFVVSGSKGHLLFTNEHVIRDARWVQMFFESSVVALGGTVLAFDRGRDLAVVGLPRDNGLAPLRLGDGEQTAIGEPIVAVGARPARRGTEAVSNPGSVTALGVRFRGLAASASIIETDAAIEVGDSGGPLLNGDGLVVGVMVARDRGDTGAEGRRRSYAVALRPGHEFDELLVAAESPRFAPGFDPVFPRSRGAFLLVNSVVPGGLAAIAGLRDFDRITAIDGEPVPFAEPGQRALFAALVLKPPGSIVVLDVQRRSAEGAETFIALKIPFLVPGGSDAP